jgi:hypothetical protein
MPPAGINAAVSLEAEKLQNLQISCILILILVFPFLRKLATILTWHVLRVWFEVSCAYTE